MKNPDRLKELLLKNMAQYCGKAFEVKHYPEDSLPTLKNGRMCVVCSYDPPDVFIAKTAEDLSGLKEFFFVAERDINNVLQIGSRFCWLLGFCMKAEKNEKGL